MTNQKSLKSFFILWSGQALSLLGSRLVQFALIWWLTRTTESATILLLELLPIQGIIAIDVSTALFAILPLLFIRVPEPERAAAGIVTLLVGAASFFSPRLLGIEDQQRVRMEGEQVQEPAPEPVA